MKFLSSLTITATISCLLLTGCIRNMSSDVYSSASAVGKVYYGTVVSTRPITIKDTERLQDNGLGVSFRRGTVILSYLYRVCYIMGSPHKQVS